MEGQNRDFIKGGLPLSSGDFVDKSKAQENKNKLLVALDNINKVHEEKMTAVNDNMSEMKNYNAMGITIGMLSKENADSVNTEFSPTEYVYESQIVRDIGNSSGDIGVENPKYEYNVDNDQPEPIESYADNESGFEPSPETMVIDNTANDPGEPMLVLDDSQVGKKSKDKGKNKAKKSKEPRSSSEDIKSCRKVAWMAYILFFLPLIIMGKNSYVRHHANEGLEINIVDVIGLVLFFAGKFLTSTNQWLSIALMVSNIAGLVLLAVTTITKVYMIIFALIGKEAQSPFFGKKRMIK